MKITASLVFFLCLPLFATDVPTPRIDSSLVYSYANRAIFAFGGQDDGGPSNTIYAYSPDTSSWKQLSPEGALPPPRFGQTTIYDSKRNRIVLFGGQGRGFFNDTWVYEIALNRWTQITLGEGPSKRYGHSAIYDTATDRMIISHGFTDAGRFDDTWALEFAPKTGDSSTARWLNITPSGEKPLKRCLHHAVFDPERRQMLLYGGCASGFGPCPLGDLWAFDLTKGTWSERRAQPSPDPRQWYGAAFDTVRQRFLVWGGLGRGALKDLWEYDPAANKWQVPASASSLGTERSRHQGVFVADSAQTYFFGGQLGSGAYTNELVVYPQSQSQGPRISPAGIARVFGGTATTVAPGMLLSVFGTNLGPESGVAAVSNEQGKLPSQLAGVEVLVNGLSAPLLYASAGQLNFQAPFEISGTTSAQIAVRYRGVESNLVALPVTATSPNLYRGAFHTDGTQVGSANPARPGEIIIFFATGHGITGPTISSGQLATGTAFRPVADVRLNVGGQETSLLYSGLAPGTIGILQINAQMPNSIGAGDWPVALMIGGLSAGEGLSIPIR